MNMNIVRRDNRSNAYYFPMSIEEFQCIQDNLTMLDRDN